MVKLAIMMAIVFICYLIIKKAYIEFKKAGVAGKLDEVEIVNAQFDTIKDVDVKDIQKKKKKIKQVTS